jgi:hypothetical protein
MFARFDAWVEAADGCHWETRTRWLPTLTAGAADAIIAAKARAASHLLLTKVAFQGGQQES